MSTYLPRVQVDPLSWKLSLISQDEVKCPSHQPFLLGSPHGSPYHTAVKLLGFTPVFPTRLTFWRAHSVIFNRIPQELAQLARSRCPLSAHRITQDLHLTGPHTSMGHLCTFDGLWSPRVTVDEEQRWSAEAVSQATSIQILLLQAL